MRFCVSQRISASRRFCPKPSLLIKFQVDPTPSVCFVAFVISILLSPFDLIRIRKDQCHEVRKNKWTPPLVHRGMTIWHETSILSETHKLQLTGLPDRKQHFCFNCQSFIWNSFAIHQMDHTAFCWNAAWNHYTSSSFRLLFWKGCVAFYWNIISCVIRSLCVKSKHEWTGRTCIVSYQVFIVMANQSFQKLHQFLDVPGFQIIYWKLLIKNNQCRRFFINMGRFWSWIANKRLAQSD